MSTKKIREMLATYGRSMSVIQAKRLKADVLTEIEAIEKAARDLAEGDGAEAETWNLMSIIASEARAKESTR